MYGATSIDLPFKGDFVYLFVLVGQGDIGAGFAETAFMLDVDPSN